MIVTVMFRDRPTTELSAATWATPVTTKTFKDIAFNDEDSPIAAYATLLPQIMESIGLGASVLASSKPLRRLDQKALPESPLKLIGRDDNAVRDTYTVLLLAALTPEYSARTKERFAKKAFLALERISTFSPEYPALRARAYKAMGYRPAAIKALGAADNDEEKAILAALNGNLPELRAFNAKQKHPWKHLLQKLDEIDTATYYGVINSKQASAALQAHELPGNAWPLLVSRALTEGNLRVQQKNST